MKYKIYCLEGDSKPYKLHILFANQKVYKENFKTLEEARRAVVEYKRQAPVQEWADRFVVKGLTVEQAQKAQDAHFKAVQR